MCKCKITGCSNKKCSCFHAGMKCSNTCSCLNCTNSIKSEIKPIRVNTNVFQSVELRVLSWNLNHLSFLNHPDLIEDMTSAIQFIIKFYQPDVFVFQEIPKEKKKIGMEIIFNSICDSNYETSPLEDLKNEHVFIWNSKTIRPYHLKLDQFPKLLITENLIRPLATMRFFSLVFNEIIFITSLHLKSGDGAIDHFHSMIKDYHKCVSGRYGKTIMDDSYHILAGDFNFNIHRLPSHSTWNKTGGMKTQTSSGGKGYDFFMYYSNKNELMANQQELILTQPKNMRRSISGLSDHFPILLRLYKY